MRRIPVATSPTIFWAPMTRITCPAPDTSGPSWLPFPVHPVQPQPERLVAAGPFDVVGDADGLERLGGLVVHLGAVHEQGADQAPRVGARGGQQRPDAVAFERRCGFGDPLVGGEFGELSGHRSVRMCYHLLVSDRLPPPAGGGRAPQPSIPRRWPLRSV